MPQPSLPTYGQDLYDRVQPLAYADPLYDWPVAHLCNAFAQMFQLLETLGRDNVVVGAPGWSIVVDPNRCPVEGLPWLGQFVGARVPYGLTEDQQRNMVKDAPGWDRGSPQAIMAAASVFLTGNKTVIMRERFNQANPNVDSPGYLQIITYKNETPPADWATTNVIVDPSFESGISRWTGNNGTLLWDTSDHISGTHCMRVTATAAGPAQATQNNPQPVIGSPIPRNTWTWSVNVKGVGTSIGRSFVIQFNENGGAQANAGVALKAATLTKDWQRVSATGTIVQPDRTALVPFFATQGAGIPAGEYYLIDDVQFEINPAATPFVVGSRPAGQGQVGTAIRAQIPAGLIMDYVALEGQTYQQIYDNFATYQLVYNTYSTYQKLLDNTPG